MTPFIRHVIIVSLCLVATIAAKLYVDKVLLGEQADDVPADAVATEVTEGSTVALP